MMINNKTLVATQMEAPQSPNKKSFACFLMTGITKDAAKNINNGPEHIFLLSSLQPAFLLPLISALTSFLDWGLSTRCAQLRITS